MSVRTPRSTIPRRQGCLARCFTNAPATFTLTWPNNQRTFRNSVPGRVAVRLADVGPKPLVRLSEALPQEPNDDRSSCPVCLEVHQGLRDRVALLPLPELPDQVGPDLLGGRQCGEELRSCGRLEQLDRLQELVLYGDPAEGASVH